MTVREYIGARYVPIFDGYWDSTKEYEPLTMVISNEEATAGNSYMSKTYIPAGMSLTNSTYWVLTGEYNAQIASLRYAVDEHSEDISDINDDISDINSSISDINDGISNITTEIGSIENNMEWSNASSYLTTNNITNSGTVIGEVRGFLYKMGDMIFLRITISPQNTNVGLAADTYTNIASIDYTNLIPQSKYTWRCGGTGALASGDTIGFITVANNGMVSVNTTDRIPLNTYIEFTCFIPFLPNI